MWFVEILVDAGSRQELAKDQRHVISRSSLSLEVNELQTTELKLSQTLMPVQGIRTIASSRNGVGAFILQCKRLDFHYCDWAGSSRGMNSFLTHTLPLFAASHPQIEITVSPRPHRHPVIKGTYINGREKAVCVRNLEKEQILQKAELLRDANGEKLRRVMKPVGSGNESVRGVWSPYHGVVQRI